MQLHRILRHETPGARRLELGGGQHAAALGGVGFAERGGRDVSHGQRSEEHTSELQSLMRISYAVFCLKKKKTHTHRNKKTICHTNIGHSVLIRQLHS